MSYRNISAPVIHSVTRDVNTLFKGAAVLPRRYFLPLRAVLLAAIFPGILLPFSVFASATAEENASETVAETLSETHAEALKLTAAQVEQANIKVVDVTLQGFNLESVATATLISDRDKTSTLAPQLDVQVLARHVVPGQEVKQGQALLTLGGNDVATAQANYINAAAEWGRLAQMSEGTISASSRLQAQVDAELKRAILASINMTPAQIKALESNPKAIGSYALLAPIAGRVQQDVAKLGQVFSSGTALMQLTDESHLWVEAQLTASQSSQITVGSQALVHVGSTVITGDIIGRSHEFDATTRTEKVLLRIDNPDHTLHAGQFAELYFSDSAQRTEQGVLLPDAALTRSGDGDWQVFIQDEDGFEAQEVSVISRQRGLSLVRGLAPNTAVVVSGAFFLASEQAKSGFDIHGH